MEGEANKTHYLVEYNKNNDDEKNLRNMKPPNPKNKTWKFKGRGPMNIIKVVLYMMRKKGDKTSRNMSPSLTSTTNTTLTNLVGTFRPLHLQSGVGGMSSPPPPPGPPSFSNQGMTEEVMDFPMERFEVSTNHSKYASSSSSSSSSRSSSSVGLSSYGSAKSLYDLDNNNDHRDNEEEDEDNDEDAYYDGFEGDEMIDAKAEMFIAKFYQQMRLQQKKI